LPGNIKKTLRSFLIINFVNKISGSKTTDAFPPILCQ